MACNSLACLLLIALPPGPIDAFRAAHSGMNVEVVFDYQKGLADYALSGDGAGKPIQLVPIPSLCISGRWAYDGMTELLECAPLPRYEEEIAEKLKSGEIKSGEFVQMPPHFSMLYDGRNAAWVNWNSPEITMMSTDSPPYLLSAKSPFPRYEKKSLYQFVSSYFDNIIPIRARANLAGHVVETEVYLHRTGGGTTRRLEISFDPNLGYLPRLSRMFTSLEVPGEGKQLLVQEWRLASTVGLGSGEFVPSEWYECSFISTSNAHITLDSSQFLELKETLRKVHVGHFKASQVKPIRPPVKLPIGPRVRMIATREGNVPLKDAGHSLSLKEITSRSEGRVQPRKFAVRPAVDEGELHRQPPDKPWSRLLIRLLIVGAMLAVVAISWTRLRARSVPLILLFLMGCGLPSSSNSPLRIDGTFGRDVVLHEIGDNPLHLELSLRNSCMFPVTISKVDGGCTCR